MKLKEIDTLTIGEYYKISESKNYDLLIKKGKHSKAALVDHWHKINDDITDIIGENSSYKSYLVHKINAMKHRIAAAKGQKHRINFANLEEAAALKALGRKTTQTLTETILLLSKNQGFKLDKNITTEEYFTLLKINSK